MKEKKVMLTRLIAVVLVGSILFLSAESNGKAAQKNVTNSIKGKAKIEKLANEFLDFSAYQLVEEKAKTKTYDFSKDAARRKALKFNKAYANGGNYKKISKNLFGKTTSATKALSGEWGEDTPYLKLQKIYKVKKNKYVVVVKVKNKNGVEGTKETWGKFRLYISKNRKSAYGYVATKIKFML